MAQVVGPHDEQEESSWDWLLFAIGLILFTALLVFAFTAFLPLPPVDRG